MRHENKNQEKKFIERVVKIRRVTKVVKGGRRFGFSTFAVVGDGKGNVGVGLGKAQEISESARKAITLASKSMKSYSLFKNTIPHEVIGYFCGGKVLLKPATLAELLLMDPVMEAIGIKDINIKTLGFAILTM